MNKFNSASTKNLSGSLNSGMDLIDPENNVVGNLVVSAEDPPSKKMKCSSISPVTMSNSIASNTNAITTNTSSIATNSTAISTLVGKTQNQTVSGITTVFAGGLISNSVSASKLVLPGNIILDSNSSGSNLIANYYGSSLLTGNNNCSYGLYAGQSLTSGGGNSYYGFTAGRDNLIGNNFTSYLAKAIHLFWTMKLSEMMHFKIHYFMK